MEILKLNLAAFGPFTDQALVFDKDTNGINIVYGPNEAGKSSSLRGLKALLFGIDDRSPDNFIHAKDKLRITGNLRAADGRELSFARRKGRKNTLLSLSDKQLDDNVLTPFLQSVTQELFEMLFGIDHRTLVQGGKEILEQKGEVGQALFSASIGSQTLHVVLKQLDEEVGEIFKPQGSTPKINSALKEYKNLNKEIKDQALSSRKWDERRRALEAIAGELEQVQSELNSSRVEINQLKRIQRVLPKLARRNALLQKLEEMGDVLILPDDFGIRRQKAITELEKAGEIIQGATSRLRKSQEQLEILSVRPKILEQSESIEALHARLAEYRSAIQDKPGLNAEYRQLLADAESLLKDVRPNLAFEDVEELRPVVAKGPRIIDLGNQNSVLVSKMEQAENNLRDTEAQLTEAIEDRQELPQVGSSDHLRRTIIEVRKSGDLDSAIKSNLSDLSALQKECADDLAQLTLWSGSLEEILGLPVPSQESVNRFEEQYVELDNRSQRNQEKKEKNAETLRETLQQLDEIQRAGAVPTEEDLTQLRMERNQVWQLLRRQWINEEDIDGEAAALLHEALDDKNTLPDKLESVVADADNLADRLRREADRVHKQANLLAKQEDAKSRAEEIALFLDECASEKTRLDANWEALWAPCEIQPNTPREMREWLNKFEKLRDRVELLNPFQQKANESEHTRDTHIQQLKKHLNSLGREASDSKSMETMLLESEEVVNELEGAQRQLETLDKKIIELERKLKSNRSEHDVASSKLDKWKAQWKLAIEGFGLEDDVSPLEAAHFLEKLRDLFAKQKDAKNHQIRIQDIDKNVESFSKRVESVIAILGNELAMLPADEAVMRLNTLLSESQKRQSQRLQIEKQIKQTKQEIEDSKAATLTMESRLDAMCVKAKCDSHAKLEEAERRSSEYIQLKAEADGVDQEIIEIGEGATMEELEVEAKEIDLNTLPGQIDAVTLKVNEVLEPRQTKLAETKGREEKELELMDGSDTVAELSDQSHAVLASIRSNSEQYVRLKLAARILRDEIDRYRKENQGPLIKRASHHFAELTCGSFKGLKTDYNEKDEPILAGLRPNEERVHVEGMSGGTRDQLYLALRLASIEKYMENSEPMPFIVDDILVDFDDERSEAALRTLAELAKSTQVILFTHHSKVVGQARKMGSSTKVHQLG
jgi:uncharacterized protein YhaN